MWRSPASYLSRPRKRTDLAARADPPQGRRLRPPGGRPAATARARTPRSRHSTRPRRAEDPAAAALGPHPSSGGHGRRSPSCLRAQRQALALAYFGGYTQSQIAELTGVPLGTVKTRTFSAMRRLRLRLAPLANLAADGSR
jgi:hypothetical protein